MLTSMYSSLGKYLYNLDVKNRRKGANATLKEVFVGPQVKYLEIGSPENETVVIFHGFSDSKDSFLRIARRLMKHYHLIIPDMPGFGENDISAEYTYDIHQYSNWMEEFIAQIQIQDFHLVGHSMGGAIASNMASLALPQIKSLTILCGGGVITVPLVGFYQDLAEGRNLFEIHNKEDFKKFLNTNFEKMPFMPGSVRQFVYERYLRQREWYKKVMQDLIGKVDPENENSILKNALHEQLQKISIPTLIVWGEKDGLFPVENIGKEYQRHIPNSKLEVISGVGHCLNLEAPREFSYLYKNFLQSLK